MKSRVCEKKDKNQKYLMSIQLILWDRNLDRCEKMTFIGQEYLNWKKSLSEKTKEIKELEND
jgi:hypothetical protein